MEKGEDGEARWLEVRIADMIRVDYLLEPTAPSPNLKNQFTHSNSSLFEANKLDYLYQKKVHVTNFWPFTSSAYPYHLSPTLFLTYITSV